MSRGGWEGDEVGWREVGQMHGLIEWVMERRGLEGNVVVPLQLERGSSALEREEMKCGIREMGWSVGRKLLGGSMKPVVWCLQAVVEVISDDAGANLLVGLVLLLVGHKVRDTAQHQMDVAPRSGPPRPRQASPVTRPGCTNGTKRY